ncbi:MAG: hypothetical protein HY561_04605 [Gemmatimonadetes bacterium]|nr:hypothetical protein [Gemmatimonadota bacterium]
MSHDTPEPDDFEAKEVFAFFGLAAYKAQVLEQQLVSLGVMLHISGRTGVTREFIDELLAKFESHTLGRLLSEARKLTSFPASVDAVLQEALARRNFVVHRCFAHHDANFMLEPGRRVMIRELREAVGLFQNAREQLSGILMPLAERLGVTREAIAAIKQEEIDKAAQTLNGA